MRPYTITIIGAESTGKTTLSRQLADTLGGDWLCEFARPYLETTDGKVSKQSMHAIWQGQRALQHSGRTSPRSYCLQDTDLYATVGYWQLPHVQSVIGLCPARLIKDAKQLQSDLYIITKSNIAFAPDPLRYGGDHRESPDEYWLTLCKNHQLPFVALEANKQGERLAEALRIIRERSMA